MGIAIPPEQKAVTEKQRKFVHLMVYDGLDRFEAYALSHNAIESDPSARRKASNLFYKPHINNYYHALMDEVRDREIEKAVWTKELATKKLVKLIEKAEKDIYGDPEDENSEAKQLTMARLNAIVLPAKELNLMNGFNQTNLNVDSNIVQICGEEKLED